MKDGWNLCPECGIKEYEDRFPFSEWEMQKSGINMDFILGKLKEAEEAVDEMEAAIKRKYDRKLRRTNIFFSCLIGGVMLFTADWILYLRFMG